MIPVTKITGGTLDSFFLYLAILGILIAVGTAIRLKVGILRKYHIPAALIAGVIGLILGPYFLKVIPKDIMDCWSSLAGRLIVVIFAPMLMGEQVIKNKSLIKKSIGTICYSYGCFATQYAVPLLLSAFILIPLFGVNPLFSVVVEEGWMGGHGTAGGMAAVFEELGWLDGQSLSLTSATVGLLFGIISGMVLINIGVKKGWVHFIHDTSFLQAESDELFPSDKRPVSSYATIDNGVVDPMAFHLAIISIAVFLGWILRVAIKSSLKISISWFVTAMFAGLIVKLVLNHTPWRDSFDKKTVSRIQGVCLEFLVAGAVASINVSVLLAYAIPLLIQQCVMMVVMLFFATWYSRRIFGKYWFENSMINYGTFCGVFATGMLLLKTCDPELQSDALEVYAVKTPFSSWAVGGGIVTGMMPYWVANYGALKVGLAASAVMIVALSLPKILGCWFPVKNE